MAKGLPAGPGGATGQIVLILKKQLNGRNLVKPSFCKRGNKSRDIEGMRAAYAILTARGGMTSHAALLQEAGVNAASLGQETLRSKLLPKHCL